MAKEKKSKGIDHPVCPICGSRHSGRDPHLFKVDPPGKPKGEGDEFPIGVGKPAVPETKDEERRRIMDENAAATADQINRGFEDRVMKRSNEANRKALEGEKHEGEVNVTYPTATVEVGATDQYRHQKAYRARNPEKYRDYMRDYMREHRPSRAKV